MSSGFTAPVRGPHLRSSLGRWAFSDVTALTAQDDSGAALQRVSRVWVQVRDGARAVEQVVAHDKFGIGKRGRLDSEDMGSAQGELPAGRIQEVGVQERANFLCVVPLARAIGLDPHEWSR